MREAVRGLVHAGLLETHQGDGTYVVADDPDEVALTRRLGVAETRDVIDVRRGLDIVAAQLAAVRREETDLQAITTAFHEREKAVAARHLEAFADSDVEFHLAVAEAAHNPLLAGMYRSFRSSLRDSVGDASCLEAAVAGERDWHRELLTAIHDSDTEGAVRAASAMLDDHQRKVDSPIPRQRSRRPAAAQK